VNCAALPVGIIESELFGHEKGAFTGAVVRRAGRFELADRGTIFLDEIGDFPQEVQAKLLRVLQDREFERVGGTRTLKVDVRVIAATNRFLPTAVANNSLRSDLFYRLNVFPVHLPPLRERRVDILPLVMYLLEKYAIKLERPVHVIDHQTMRRLVAYSWPGNVRELKNVLGRAAALCDGKRIEAKDLFLSQGKKTATFEGLSGKTLEEIEKSAIAATLKSVDGNKTEAAKVLGIAYSTLYEKMKKYRMRE
jgi:transcriptional regulator with PAS, ATPase and Fis domain